MNERLLVIATLLCGLALLAPSAATAQEAGDIEVSGGFNYLFADLEGSGFEVVDFGGFGFQGGATFYLSDRLGFAVDIGYNSDDLTDDLVIIAIFPPPLIPDVDLTQWTVLFGPRFRLADAERFSVGAEAMAGIARGSVEVELDDDFFGIGGIGPGPGPFGPGALDIDVSETVFAAMFGIYVDLPLREQWTWRVIQPDVLLTTYGDDVQAHFRLASSLAYRF